MAKTSKVNIAEIWGYNELYPILQDAFIVLYSSYLEVSKLRKNNPYKKPQTAKKWFLEDEITDDLINGTKDIERRFEYRIQKQQQDFESNVKIDIALLYSLSFGDNSHDLKIECKRLDNLVYIVEDGIKSYKENKYSEKLPLAGMLHYNIKDEITQNIKLLNSLITKRISSSEILADYSIFTEHQYTYKSIHKRNNNADLDLYSCAFDFRELIEN